MLKKYLIKFIEIKFQLYTEKMSKLSFNFKYCLFSLVIFQTKILV